MTVTYGFYDSLDGDRVYSSGEISSIFDGIITDGIFQSYGNAFAVVDGSGMGVNVGTGRAWFNGTWTFNDAALPLTLGNADPTLPRIDTVIIEINKSVAVRANSIKVIAGTPASSPVPPTLTTSGTLFQYGLANIAVGAGVSELTSGNITNLIGTTTPFITGILTTIDMSWLFNQWDGQFTDWFTDLQNELDSNQAANLQSQINDLEAAVALLGSGALNIIHNADMSVSQRGTSETGVTTSKFAKAPDRWKIEINTLGTWTVSQDTTNSPKLEGFNYNYKLDCTTADASPAAGDYIFLRQRIEGVFLQSLKKGTASAEDLTISFWARSSKTGTYIVELFDLDNNRSVSKSYTIDAANTWEKKSITFDPDTTGVLDADHSASLQVAFWFGAGSTYTSGTLQTTWGAVTNANRAVGCANLGDNTANEFYLTGVQLEVGTSASDFEHKSFLEVFNQCSRYFQKSYDRPYDPGTASQQRSMAFGIATSTNTIRPLFRYLQEMRTNPTITIYSYNGTLSKVSNGASFGTDVGGTVTAPYVGNSSILAFQDSGSSFTVGDLYAFHFTADAEV